MPPFIHSSQTPIQTEKYVDKSKDLLEELGVNSQQFKNLSENLPLGLALYKIIYDRENAPVDFVTLEVNPAYETDLGVKREQIVSKNVLEVYPEIKVGPIDWIDTLGRVGRTGVSECFEVIFPQNNKCYQVYAYCPRKGFCIAAFMNITQQKKKKARELEQQKKSEQQLSFSEKKYRRLYETTQDGIMARDLQGKMIDCNIAYAKMLSYTKKELKNLAVQQLLPEKWHQQREEIVNKVLLTGRSIVFEREYKRKDGTVFPASVRTWRLTDGKGKVIGIWSIVRDITEQKASQRNLEMYADVLKKIIEDRTKQLKDSERLAAIGQTAGMVGHDLRNPLQTITGELYLAKGDVESLAEGDAKSNLQESIHVIEEQAAYMDKIVSDLQAFVQPIRIDKKPINLKELAANVLASVATPNSITVQNLIQEDFPQIKADLQLLKRVLINLVTNSVQAMPDGGKLTLTGQVNPDGQVLISVQDTGVGIPDAIKNQIFTPLFTTKPRGQGFGLAVCKRLMEAQNSTITFTSKEGNGTIFTITLPSAQ